MRSSRKTGFTLVEILIVVVILGILAAIVVPQFVNASDSAIKGALQSQLQTISSQIELYRVQNGGAYPTEDPDDPMEDGGNNDGWGVMVGQDYLKEVPMNGYTKSGVVAFSDDAQGDSEAATRDDDNGWYYATSDDAADPPAFLQGRVFAAGLTENRDNPDEGALLEHEVEEADGGEGG